MMIILLMAMMMVMIELTCTPIAFHTLRCTLSRISGPSRNRPLRKPDKNHTHIQLHSWHRHIMIMKVILVMITKNVTWGRSPPTKSVWSLYMHSGSTATSRQFTCGIIRRKWWSWLCQKSSQIIFAATLSLVSMCQAEPSVYFHCDEATSSAQNLSPLRKSLF